MSDTSAQAAATAVDETTSHSDSSTADDSDRQQQQQQQTDKASEVSSATHANATSAAAASSSPSSPIPPLRASHALHRTRPGSPASTSTAAFGFGFNSGARSSSSGGPFLAAGGAIAAARAQSPISHAKLAHLKRKVEAQQAWGAASASGSASRSESPVQIPAPGRAQKLNANKGSNGVALPSDPAAAAGHEWTSASPARAASSSSPSASAALSNLSLHDLLTMEPGSPLGVAGARGAGGAGYAAGLRAETPPTQQLPQRQQQPLQQRWVPPGLEQFEGASASGPNGSSDQRFVPSRLQFQHSSSAAGMPVESAYSHGAPFIPAAAAASVAAAASYPVPPADQMIRPLYSPPRSMHEQQQQQQQEGPSLSAAMRSARPASLSIVARSPSAVRPLQSFDARGVPIPTVPATATPSAPRQQQQHHAQIMRTPLSPTVSHLALHNALQSLKSPAPAPNASSVAAANKPTDAAESTTAASDPALAGSPIAASAASAAVSVPLHKFETPVPKFVAPQVAEPIGLPVDDTAARSIGVRSLKQAHATRLGMGKVAPGSSPVAQPLMADARHVAVPLSDLGFDDESGVDTDPARPSLPASLRSRNQAVMIRAEALVSPLPAAAGKTKTTVSTSASTPNADRSGYTSVLHSTFSPTPVRSKPLSGSSIEQALHQRLQAHEEQQAQQAMQLRRLQLQLQLQQAQIQSTAAPVTPTVVPASASIRNHAGPLSSPAATGSFLSSFFPASPPLSSPNALSSLRAQAPQSAPRASPLLCDAEVPVSLAKRPKNDLGYDPVSTPAKPGAHPLPQRSTSSQDSANAAASSTTASAVESVASSAATSPKPLAATAAATSPTHRSAPPFFLDLKRLLSPDPAPRSPVEESKPSATSAAVDDDEPQSHRSDHVGDVSDSSSIVEDHPAVSAVPASFSEASKDIAWTGPLLFLQQLDPLIKAVAANSAQATSLPEQFASLQRDGLHVRETVAALRRFGSSAAGARLLRTSESTTLLKKVHEAITSSANALLHLLCNPPTADSKTVAIGPVSSRDRAIVAVRALCASLSPHASGSSTSTGSSLGTRIALLSIEAASGEECFWALEAALVVLSRALEVAPLRTTTKASSEHPVSPVVSPINTPRDEPEPVEPEAAEPVPSTESSAVAAEHELEAVATHNFVGSAVGQLTFMKSGEVLSVRSKAVMGWVAVQNAAGVRGHVPESYLTFRRVSANHESAAAKATEEAAAAAEAAKAAVPSLPRIQALYPYTAAAVGQIGFAKGEILWLLANDMPGWLLAQKTSAAAGTDAGAKGHVPENYFKRLPMDTPPASAAKATAPATVAAAAAVPASTATSAATDSTTTVGPAVATTTPSSEAKVTEPVASSAAASGATAAISSIAANAQAAANASPNAAPVAAASTDSSASAPAAAAAAAGATAATPGAAAVAAPAGSVVTVKALFAFTSTAVGQLSVRQHELLTVVSVPESERQAEWLMVRNAAKAQGFVPRNYCSPPITKVRAAPQEDAAAVAAKAQAAAAEKAQADAAAAAAAAAAALLTPFDTVNTTPVDPVDAEAEAWAQRLSTLESETRAAHIKAVALRAAYTKKAAELMRTAPGTDASIELYHAQEAEAAEERALQAYEAAFDAHEDWKDGRQAAEAEAVERGEKEIKDNPEAAAKHAAAGTAATEADPLPASAPTLASASSSTAAPVASATAAAPAEAAASTPAVLEAVGLYLFMAPQTGQLAFKVGEVLEVVQAGPLKGWLVARNNRGMEGHIPENYVRIQTKEGTGTAAATAAATKPQEETKAKSAAVEAGSSSAAPSTAASSSSPFVPGSRVTVLFPLLPSLSGGHLAAQAGEVLEILASSSSPSHASGSSGMVRAKNKQGQEGMVPIKYLQPVTSHDGDDASAATTAPVVAHEATDVEAHDRLQESKYADPASSSSDFSRPRSSSFPHLQPASRGSSFYTPTASSDEMLERDLELLAQTDAAIDAWNARTQPSHPQPVQPHDSQFDASNMAFAGLELTPEEQTRLADQLDIEIDLGAGTPAARSGSSGGGGADHLDLELDPLRFGALRSVALSRTSKPYAPFAALPFLRSRYDLSREVKEGMEGVLAFVEGEDMSQRTLEGMHSLIEARGLSGVYDELAETLTALGASFCKAQHLLFERAMVAELRLEHAHMASLAAGDPSEDVEHRLMDRLFDARSVVEETMQLREARERLAKREARIHELEQQISIMDRVFELQRSSSVEHREQAERAERLRTQQAQWDADESSGDDEPDDSGAKHLERLNPHEASDAHHDFDRPDSYPHAHVHRRQHSREGMMDSVNPDTSASAAPALDPTPVTAFEDGEFDPHAHAAPPPPSAAETPSATTAHHAAGAPLHSILHHSARLSPLVVSDGGGGGAGLPPLIRGNSDEDPPEVHNALTNTVSPAGPRVKKLRDTRSISAQRQERARAYSSAHESDPTPITPHDGTSLSSKSASGVVGSGAKSVRWAPDSTLVNQFVNPAVESAYARDPDDASADAEGTAGVMEEKTMEEVARQIEEEQAEEQEAQRQREGMTHTKQWQAADDSSHAHDAAH